MVEPELNLPTMVGVNEILVAMPLFVQSSKTSWLVKKISYEKLKTAKLTDNQIRYKRSFELQSSLDLTFLKTALNREVR